VAAAASRIPGAGAHRAFFHELLGRQELFFTPEEEIKHLESVLTIVGGKVVYAREELSKLAPAALNSRLRDLL
jgi:hypothetical protein